MRRTEYVPDIEYNPLTPFSELLVQKGSNLIRLILHNELPSIGIDVVGRELRPDREVLIPDLSQYLIRYCPSR